MCCQELRTSYYLLSYSRVQSKVSLSTVSKVGDIQPGVVVGRVSTLELDS